jgi:hypothetical protein
VPTSAPLEKVEIGRFRNDPFHNNPAYLNNRNPGKPSYSSHFDRAKLGSASVIIVTERLALIALLPREFPGEMAVKNLRHYESCCAHGSSLSAELHALRLDDPKMAPHYLREAAATEFDLDPNSGGGVRFAKLAGMWQTVSEARTRADSRFQTPIRRACEERAIGVTRQQQHAGSV